LAVVSGSQLPRHPAFFGMAVRTVIERQLNGGDDYELIGTCNKADFPAIAKAAKAHNTPLQMVGFIKSKDTTQQTHVDWQNTLKVPVKGYDHFI
jgi:thiamine monophosphate kinase